jgi:hypothetical protein
MTELNKNMLSPLGFNFKIEKTPDMNFFVQSVSLPGIQLGQTEMPNPFKSIPVYGDHITYGDLDVTFKVNEDLSNYIELFDWITGIGFPDNYNQHAELANQPISTGQGLESDATLTVLSSAMNPVIIVQIKDLFPISLTPLEFNSRDIGVEYIEATVSFKFLNYTFRKV